MFLVGLVDWRRPLSLRNLDLLVLLSFSISLAYFNQGNIFWSVPLQYPPLIYLLVRLTGIGLRGRRQPAFSGRLPLWLLAGVAVFLIGFRGGLNAYNSNVIDVGYAGVIGADRLVRGDLPYGHFPGRTGDGCGVKYADGIVRGLPPGGRRRALRVAERERRHVRAGQLRRLRAGARAGRLDRPVGRPAVGPRDLGDLRRARAPSGW